MAAPVTPCDSCGSPILDSDLETGAAVTLLGKRYCPGCKGDAIRSVSLDDLAKPAAAKPAPPKPPPKAPSLTTPPTMKAAPAKTAAPVKAATPPSPARPAPPKPAPGSDSRKPARRPAAVAAPASSKKPLILAGAGVAAVLLIVGGVFLFRGSPPPDGGGGTTTKGGSGGTSKTPVDPAVAARDAYAKVEDLAVRSGVSWDHLLAAAEKARAVCKGTEWEKKLEEIHARATQEKEAEEASREITPLLDELKGAVATDPEFKRFPELQKKFEQLLEMAGKSRSVKMAEIRALQREYNGKYEKLAEPHYTEINEAATQLADERRFDDALRKINTFPQHLRHSGAWSTLEKLKLDIERRKKK